MVSELRKSFEKYADLVIKVGLNLQKGQRLVISAPIEAAELTRLMTAKAYDAGCPYVDVNFLDEELSLIRFRHAPKDSFKEFPTWRIKGNIERAEEGAAFLSIAGNNPDLLKEQDPNLVAIAQKTAAEHSKPFSREYISKMKVSWCVISAAVAPWAARVFPDEPADEQVGSLWDAIFQMCRLDEADPTVAWREHIETLECRRAYLNERAYSALKYTAPGTDLTLGLPNGHIWKGGVDTNEKGTLFVPNIPTEEVFTMPHCQRTDGMVSSTKPLNYGGRLIENFSLTFQAGRVVGVEAESGRDVLKKLVETDEGAARLGEVALVPNSSPISRFGKLFYNTLFDENASNHLALGQAYNVCLEKGEAMSEVDFSKAGGNTSVTHVDFMIGSEEMDIDGVLPNGSTEPVMRAGEWAFEA
ncbi:MAG: aminopeptidase [Candidatus Latescibacterota bacterium]|nr:aminopeptidase [Candidatus Latescibacterota bacterium]